jgi:hypothetical protein
VKGWLTIGGVRLGQPAELAKPLTALMLARVLTARRESPKSLIDLWKPALVVGVPWLLIMAQPDLGFRDRVHRHPVRDAVLGRHPVAHAGAAREPRGEPDRVFSVPLWGRGSSR